MQVARLFNIWLVSGYEEKLFRLFWLNQRRAVRDDKSNVETILLLKTYQKCIIIIIIITIIIILPFS